MPYAEYIPSQDPNKSQEQIDTEAAYAYSQLRRGEKTAADIARELGIGRSTLFNRINELKLIIGLPDHGLARALHYDRLEELYLRSVTLLDGDVSNADSARLIAEARQVLARQSALLRLEQETGTPQPDPEPGEAEDWEVAEEDHG